MFRRTQALVQRPEPVAIRVDGEAVMVEPGESLAVALAVHGRMVLRKSPNRGDPRGAFCMMGVCQECAVVVDGKKTTACTVSVHAGMIVETGVTQR